MTLLTFSLDLFTLVLNNTKMLSLPNFSETAVVICFLIMLIKSEDILSTFSSLFSISLLVSSELHHQYYHVHEHQIKVSTSYQSMV